MATAREWLANFYLANMHWLSRLRGIPVLGAFLHSVSHALLPARERYWTPIQTGIAQGLWLKLDPRVGQTFARGDLEPAVQAMFTTHLKTGMVFYDIGANIGFYSLAAARLVGAEGKVYAFEPDQVNVSLLEENVARNALHNIHPVRAAVCHETGFVAFLANDPRVSPARDTGRIVKAGEGPDRAVVPSITLDEFVLTSSPPDFIKCDVEGAEFDVLCGAREVFALAKPILLCEVHHCSLVEPIEQWLRERNYQVEWLESSEAFPKHLLATPLPQNEMLPEHRGRRLRDSQYPDRSIPMTSAAPKPVSRCPEPLTRLRVLLVLSHPVQYTVPTLRLMAQDPRIELQVAYCSLQGADRGVDPDFGVEVQWDVPLLDGYSWVEVPNKSRRPGPHRFLGLVNPGLWSLIRKHRFDAVIVHTGYLCASFWIAVAAANLSGSAVLFGTDATTLRPRIGAGWKAFVKRLLWPFIFRLADIVILPSTAGLALFRFLGFPADRLVMTPFVVDNDWWLRQSARADRAATRAEWGIPSDAVVALFCAKFQPWKRPHDALRAFAGLEMPNAYLVFAGDGPLRQDLESEARSLGVFDRVRFLGFVNQSSLPAAYVASDLFLLPSEYDACPAVVCEAMLCGCPVVISDQIRGRFDIVRHAETGFVFPCADVEALAAVLREAFSDPSRLRHLGEAARRRMESWSPRENVDAVVEAVQKATARKRGQA